MSRRRTEVRFIPITFSISPALLNEVDEQLRPLDSRSAWIVGAIEQRLNGGGGITMGNASDTMLKHAYHARVCGCHEYDTCTIAATLDRMQSN